MKYWDKKKYANLRSLQASSFYLDALEELGEHDPVTKRAKFFMDGWHRLVCKLDPNHPLNLFPLERT